MFSSSVIWAIHVLSELGRYERDSSDEINRGVVFTTDNQMQKPVLRKVMKKLVAAGYVERLSANNAYRLATDISSLTVCDLIRHFHGGICIGEIYDHYQTVGREPFRTKGYRDFLQFENKLQKSLEKQLQKISVGDF